jgi:hypothetical protein
MHFNLGIRWKGVMSVTLRRHKTKKKKNSVAVVRKQTIPTERPPLVGEVSANFCG